MSSLQRAANTSCAYLCIHAQANLFESTGALAPMASVPKLEALDKFRMLSLSWHEKKKGPNRGPAKISKICAATAP